MSKFRAQPLKTTGSVGLTLLQEDNAELFGCEALLPVSEAIKDGDLVRPLSVVCAAYFPRMDPNSAWIVEPRSGAAVGPSEMRAGLLYAIAGEPRHAPLGSVPVVSEPLYRVLFGTSEEMLRHASANARVPECPARLARAVAALDGHDVAGPLVRSCPRITPRLATLDEIATVHDRELYRGFVERGESLEQAMTLPTDVYCSGDGSSSIAALTACGLVIDAVEAVVAGRADSAFCLVRPPGHHCSCSQPNGFCLVNNVAVAAMVARQRHEGTRIAVVDIDVHHGEGTQSVLEPFADMMYLSLHRYDSGTFFPYRKQEAASSYTGEHGNIVNVACDTDAHSPRGLHKVISDELFHSFLQEVVVPALTKFQPTIVLVSCGFDAAHQDPLGRMAVVNGYGLFMEGLQDFAAPRKVGLVVALEGGYNLEAIAANTVRVYLALTFGSDGEKQREQSKQGRATPPTWDEVRKKQLREAMAQGADAADQAGSMVPADDVLQRQHREWIAATIHTTRLAHNFFS